MSDIVIDVDSAEVMRMLERVRLRTSNQRIPIFLDNIVAPYLRDQINRRFNSEGDDVVGKWAPLRDTTRAIRVGHGFPAAHPINRRTGALLRWVRSHRTTKWTLTFPGTNGTVWLRSKLAVAQRGGFPTYRNDGIGSIGPSRPAVPRPVLGLGNRDRDWVMTRLESWVMGGGHGE